MDTTPKKSDWVDDNDLAKPKTPAKRCLTALTDPHKVLCMEDVLEIVFSFLDTSSLKHCRQICSIWTPVATRFLMQRAFCALPSIARDNAERYYSTKSLSSVKIDDILLSRLSAPQLASYCIPPHWKSIYISLIPNPAGVTSLTSFLALSCPEKCPMFTHLKIQFALDPLVPTNYTRVQFFSRREHMDIAEFDNLIRLNEGLINGRQVQQLLRNRPAPIPIPRVEPLKSPLPIQSLHLIIEERTNIPQVLVFMKVILRKQIVPSLKELVVEFPQEKCLGKPSDAPKLPQAYRPIVETLGECGSVLRTLRVFKIKGNIPLSVWNLGCQKVSSFLRKASSMDLPGSDIKLDLGSELEELTIGSGIIGTTIEGAPFAPFLPGIITPIVADNLKSLDLSGFYVIEGNHYIYPQTRFPFMPNLQKLTAEELVLRWIRNFQTIFEAAPNIREMRVKNSWAHKKVSPFLTLEHMIDVEKWESLWGLGEYPSMKVLELGDTIDVRKFVPLRKLGKIFPNIEVFEFNCDDKQRRLTRKKDPNATCEVDFLLLQGIIEGLKGWKCLRHLKVTYWPLYSVNELLDHFINAAAKLKSLRLYDFRRSDEANPTLHMEELRSQAYMKKMKNKLGVLQESPELVIVLRDFHCPHKHIEDRVNGKIVKRLRKCSVMDELFQFANKVGISNFRQAIK